MAQSYHPIDSCESMFCCHTYGLSMTHRGCGWQPFLSCCPVAVAALEAATGANRLPLGRLWAGKGVTGHLGDVVCQERKGWIQKQPRTPELTPPLQNILLLFSLWAYTTKMAAVRKEVQRVLLTINFFDVSLPSGHTTTTVCSTWLYAITWQGTELGP